MNKLFKLTSTNKYGPKHTQVIVAKDNEEALQLLGITDLDYLVEEIDLTISQVIDLGIIGPAFG